MTPQLWNVYRAAAQKAVSEGCHADAEAHWLSALEIAESCDDVAILIATLENLVEVFWHQKKFSLAAPVLRRLLRIYEQRFGSDHFDVGIIANNMAMLYHAWGKYPEAEVFYKRALSIKQRPLGPQHPEVLGILEKYANLLVLLNRDEEARQLESRVRELRQEGSKRTVPDIQAMPHVAKGPAGTVAFYEVGSRSKNGES